MNRNLYLFAAALLCACHSDPVAPVKAPPAVPVSFITNDYIGMTADTDTAIVGRDFTITTSFVPSVTGVGHVALYTHETSGSWVVLYPIHDSIVNHDLRGDSAWMSATVGPIELRAGEAIVTTWRVRIASLPTRHRVSDDTTTSPDWMTFSAVAEIDSIYPPAGRGIAIGVHSPEADSLGYGAMQTQASPQVDVWLRMGWD